MVSFDEIAPNYRRAKERWPDAPSLVRCHESLTKCFDGDCHGLTEHIKSFIESVCVTILGEFNEHLLSSNPSTTELLVAALRPLGLQNTRGASKLNKVLSGFNKLTDALTEMRNEHGPIAHGRDIFLDPITIDHARAFLHTGDAILSVLLNTLDGKEPDLLVTREPYESFPHLNERIDRAVRVEATVDEEGNRPILVLSVTTNQQEEAIKIRVEPSRLLYGVDRSAYIETLKTVTEVVKEVLEEEPASSKMVEQPPIAVVPEAVPAAEVVKGYTGRLAAMRPALREYLAAEGWDADTTAGDADFVDSLLATVDRNMGVDWKQRDTLKARLKVACQRVFVQFKCDSKKAEKIASRLVAWFRIQAPDDGNFSEVKTDGTQTH